MSLRPLHDTAGVGLSLLDMTVHARVDASGVLPRTRTRIVYAFKHNGDAEAVVALHRGYLADTDAEATGLLVVQPGAGLHVLETGPDTVAGLMRALAAEGRAGGESAAASAAAPAHSARSDLGAPGAACGRVSSVRVIGMTEDVPTPAFGPWASRVMHASLPAAHDGAPLESEPPVVAAARLVKALVAMGHAVQQRVRDANAAAAAAGEEAPDTTSFLDDALFNPANCAVPSAERCGAWATSAGIPDVEDWLELFDAPAALLGAGSALAGAPRLLY